MTSSLTFEIAAFDLRTRKRTGAIHLLSAITSLF